VSNFWGAVHIDLLVKIKGGDLLFSEMSKQLVKDADLYFANHDYKQTTSGRFHFTVLMCVKVAIKEGHLDTKKNPYDGYVVDNGQSARANIEPEELKLLENVDRRKLGNPRLEYALDRFLYSCYTGLRIGDNILLSKEHVKKSGDGLMVEMITEKGKGQRILHHLAYLFNGKPQTIVQKYQKLFPDQPSIFPPEGRSMLDTYIKKVAKITDITRKISFHMARHTCGTALVDISANPYLIMDIMGHADINTSMIYIHRSSERVKKQLQNLKWNW
jgi:integrase